MKLAIYGSNARELGYGRMANEIRSAITRQGVEIIDYGDNAKASHVLFITHPSRPGGWYEGQSTTIFTMWETTELAFDHLTSLPFFEKILVPCEANREIFSRVHENVSVVPLGCDYERYFPIKRTLSHPFTVITGGKGPRRKGFDMAYRVFNDFSKWVSEQGYQKPRLIIKGDATLSRHHDDIIVVKETLTPEDEAKMYASAHVYLGLSRGEGWGMIPHQTIAQACPTILTDAAGHAEFSKYGIPLSWHPVEAINEIVGRSGNWWEPDEEEALEALKSVFSNYEFHSKRAMENADKILEFNWDRTATEILENLPEPGKLTGKWVEFPKAYLSLKVLRPLDCNIGAEVHSFRPGTEYNVTADVKRVIYDAGYLDPACIDPFEKAIYEKPRPSNIDEGFAA